MDLSNNLLVNYLINKKYFIAIKIIYGALCKYYLLIDELVCKESNFPFVEEGRDQFIVIS